MPAAGSTWSACIKGRSNMSPPSTTACPATAWPPPRTDTGRRRSRANLTADDIVWERRNTRPRASVLGVARKLALVGLIVLILLLVLPLGIGMAMGVCPDCRAPGPQTLSFCIALVAGITLLLSAFAVWIEPQSRSMPLLLIPRLLERPPRSA